MSFPIPELEPLKFTAGDTLEFTRSFPNYTPAEGYTLKYSFRGPMPINLTATTSGSGFLISVAAATTKTYVPGVYYWESYVEKGSEQHTISRGQMEIRRSLRNTTDQVYDGRSPAAMALDAIEAVLTKSASRQQQEYEIDGVKVMDKSIADLLTLRDHYKLLVNQETSLENIENGRPGRKKLQFRFTRS